MAKKNIIPTETAEELSPAVEETFVEKGSEARAEENAADQVVENAGISDAINDSESPEADSAPEIEAPVVKKAPRVRGKKYQEARGQVDRTKDYPLDQAIDLLKKTSYSKFDGTVTMHLNLKREVKQIDVVFPHSVGKEMRVAIATDELIADIGRGVVEFDILLAEPKMMPKLAKLARVLGPKGLMPNPKAGTVTTDPATKKKSLESGASVVRGEKKTPLMHVRVGKTNQSTQELQENILAVLNAVNSQNIYKLTLAATMSPGVKVIVEKEKVL